MLMSPNKGDTAVHDCHCQGDVAVRVREVLARPWVGVYVPLALILSCNGWAAKYLLTIVQSKPQPHLKDSSSNQQQQSLLLHA